jgi:serpin B
VVENHNPSAFGTNLFSELCDEFEGNILLSPFSVYLALSLLKDGATAGSKTESELLRVLGPESAQNQAKALRDEFIGRDSNSEVQLSVATSIWADGLKTDYIKMAEEKYSAEAMSLPDSYSVVNRWVEEKTDGMIKQAMPEGGIDSLVTALLVNAVHFKGQWTYQFKPSDSFNGQFTLYEETKIRARYMSARRPMKVVLQSGALGGAQVLVLDYGKKGSSTDFSAIFIKPAEPGHASMNNVISGLRSSPISEILDEVRSTDVKLELPRFRLDYGPESLKPSLQNMGVTAAFTQCIPSRRRFFRYSGMCMKFDRMSDDPWLYVDDVMHGACMEVTEDGTEAAAATTVIMKTRSRPRSPMLLSFDRPFVALIYYHRTATPLFIARVETPEFLFEELV